MYRIFTNSSGSPRGYWIKLLIAMKLITLLVTVTLVQVSAATFGQRVTLHETDVTMEQVFREIRKQTGYHVLVKDTDLLTRQRVSVQFDDMPIEQVVEYLAKQGKLDFEIADKTVVLSRKAPAARGEAGRDAINRASDDDAGSRVSRVLAIPAVTGRITDTLGQPLAGASIVVLSPEGKRTSLQTTTNHLGVFTLQNVPDGAMLRISFMGYIEQEVPANAQIGTIRLKPSESPLDEVQVMAYGTTSRRLSTGNIGTVKAKDIENQPVTNPLLALKGRIPGLVVTQNTGMPGGGVVVRIQGQNSIASGNAPLFVVDGVPIESYLRGLNSSVMGNSGIEYGSSTRENEGNPLSYLNPTDIESIDVLKDADATAIYGSRAANGAILITTKKGRVGKMQLSFGMNQGWGKAPYNTRFKMLDTRQYLDMRYEAYRNDGIDWRDPSVNAPDLKLWDTTRNVNWQNEFLNGTMRTQHIQASVSGGTTGIQYRLSGTYNKSGDLFPDQGNGNPIVAISANVNSISANQRLNMSWTTNYQHNHNELPGYSFMDAALLLPPHAPDPFNADGTINWAPDANGNSTYMLNPYRAMTDVLTNTTTKLITNLGLGYKITKDLEIRTSLGYSKTLTDDFLPTTTSGIQPEYRATTQNSAQYGYRVIPFWIAEPQLQYKKMTGFGKVDLLLGSSLQESKSMVRNVRGVNYASDAMLDNLGAAGALSNITSINTHYRYLAYFGRFTYNLQDQVILNMNMRRDGSSRFGENRRFSNFGSIAGTWIFSQQEAIQQALPWLSFGKLQTSYGVTGNDNIGDFQFIRTYQTFYVQVPYQGIAALQSPWIGNPELVWERNKKFSTGLDLGFLKDRILLHVAYAHNISDNQLVGVPLSSVTGYASVMRNWDAAVRNTTWEFSLSTTNIKTVNFNWTTSFNTSIARNKLVYYPDLEQSPYATSLVLGQPIDMRRLFRFGGVNSATGDYQYLDRSGNPTSLPKNDDAIFRSFFPPFYGGLQNRMSWKNISLDFAIEFKQQFAPNVGYHTASTNPGAFSIYSGGNQPVTVLDRWRQPGDNATLAKYSTTYNDNFYNIQISDVWFSDASYARLGHASLSWQLPLRWVKNTGLQSASVVAGGQNLYTITRYDGPDPETQSLLALPPLRSFTFGVQIIL